jgi:hypothetical protein
MLVELLQSTPLVTFEQIQAALGDASRATTFRYLKQVPTLRSYNHNGRYYAFRDPTRFDRCGLASHGDVHFSRDGTLSATVKRLIRESTAGWTQKELQALLHVRVQVVLLEAVRQQEIQRDKIDGFYLYLHAEPSIAQSQRQARQAQRDAHRVSEAADAVTVNSELIIEVLLVLIRHPGSAPAQVLRHLHGHSPPITFAQVTEVFARYALEEIGKKGGATHS